MHFDFAQYKLYTIRQNENNINMGKETMKFKILDTRKNGAWVLAKVSAWEYLEQLSSDFFKYDIQRGIVNNRYLDSILESIGLEEVLPPFTLVTTNRAFSVSEDGLSGEVSSFDILDGLQRTYRLWVHKEITSYVNKDPDATALQVLQSMRKRADINKDVLTLNHINKFFSKKSKINVSNFEEKLRDYDIYINLWIGLSEKDTIKQMLILNAGQKKVALAHQYELMYLKLFKSIGQIEGVNLVRFKAREATKVSRGDRNVGDYLITSVIIALQSYIAGKPVRLEANALNIDEMDSDDYISTDSLTLYFNKQFVRDFISIVNLIDISLSENNPLYLKWFSKDTTISSIFGAIGYLVREKYCKDDTFAAEGFEYVREEIMQKFHGGDVFNLDEYEYMYSSLSSTRINIGSVVRKTIFDYTKDLLTNNNPSWIKSMNLIAQKDAKK